MAVSVRKNEPGITIERKKDQKGKTISNISSEELGLQRRQKKREENVPGRGNGGEQRSGTLRELKLAQLEKDMGRITMGFIRHCKVCEPHPRITES